MINKKYEILDEFGTIIATGMEFDMAMAFIRGYAETFYNEHLNLTIREVKYDLSNMQKND